MHFEKIICRLYGSNFSLLAQTVQAVAREHTYTHTYIHSDSIKTEVPLFYHHITFGSKTNGFQKLTSSIETNTADTGNLNSQTLHYDITEHMKYAHTICKARATGRQKEQYAVFHLTMALYLSMLNELKSTFPSGNAVIMSRH